MSGNYVPLYRKYRPQTLDKLVGQEHIKKTLTSAIELGKIAHAFLFTGPRGTGKTSTARILAKSLNCKNGPTIHPCGECESCKDITNSIPIDVIEMDAASNRSVEDAQNILEKIQYAPVHGKFKIYIIDEVHMLSSTAFNALLKTLEEPPENVIFILATTEVHKVLDTIKSRCQRFDFRRITTDDIVKHLRYIADEEKINITDDALYSIAKNSAGGMRDSISLLDQLSLLGATEQVTSDDVNSILGRISFDTLYDLSSKVISGSPNEAIELLNDIYNSGNEPLQILTNLAEYFKNLLIAKNSKKELMPELTSLNEPQIDLILKQKDLLETQQIVFIFERITHYIKEIKQTSNQHLWLEVAIIDIANMAENSTLADLQRRVSALEGGEITVKSSPIKPAKPSVSPISVSDKTEQPKPEPKQQEKVTQAEESTPANTANEPEFTPPPLSKKNDGMDIGSLWNSLLSNIKSAPTKAILSQLGTPVKISKDEIIITFKTESLVSQFLNTNKKQIVEEAASVMFGTKNPNVTVKLSNGEKADIQGNKSTVEEQKKNDVSIPQTEPEQINTENNTFKNKKSEKEVTNPVTSDTKITDNEKKHLESDQEKMVLELFDGKFIE